MSARKDGDQDFFDDFILADDHGGDFLLERIISVLQMLDRIHVGHLRIGSGFLRGFSILGSLKDRAALAFHLAVLIFLQVETASAFFAFNDRYGMLSAMFGASQFVTENP